MTAGYGHESNSNLDGEINDAKSETFGGGRTSGTSGRTVASSSRRTLLRVAGASVAAALATPVASAADGDGADGPEAGVYVDADDLDEYEEWLDAEVTVASVFLSPNDWQYIEGDQWVLDRWEQWTRASDDHRMAMYVPMFPTGEGSLAAGADGDYDYHFEALAESLVDRGMEDASLRIAAEFTGDWNPGYAGENPEAWAEYWRNIVETMRAVDDSFRFNWNPNSGSPDMGDPANAWPGDEYVDEVGVDLYDQSWVWDGDYQQDEWLEAWDVYENAPYCLDYWKEFADGHGKPLTVPEWGVVHMLDGGVQRGGGDNPEFVRKMYEWMTENDVAWQAYAEMESSYADHRLFTGSRFPEAADAYRSTVGDD